MKRLTNTSNQWLLWYSPNRDEYYAVEPGGELPDLSNNDEWLFHSPHEQTHTLKVLCEHDRISKMEDALEKTYSYASYRY